MGQNFKKTDLNSGWEFTQSGKNKWLSAQIPGSVQSNLIRLQQLPNPFWGTNEKQIQWIEDSDWDFRKSFYISQNDLNFDDIYLNFEGLDTFADIFLNGQKIGFSQNMFIKHTFPVKNILKIGENRLDIHFFSPIKFAEPKRKQSGFEYPAANDHRKEKVSVYSRKAPYHFGWDWGIRIVQMGIWKPVWLHFQKKAMVTDFFIEQKNISEEKADIQQHIEINSFENTNAKLEISYEIDAISEKNIFDISLKKGDNFIDIPLSISNPKLWQPNGWGKAHRYRFSAKLFIDNQLISEQSKPIGLRSIKLIQNPEKNGKSFYFEVNGKPLFAKGANYIPGEILTSEQSSEYYQKLFKNILAGNMNMIRVWGGGIYENDTFYNLADENGILIWQDFMFACTPYPHDDDFLKNISQEAQYQIKRLRNYACIALWCGNNEVEESIKYWGLEQQVPAWAYQNFKKGYDIIFRKQLSEIVSKNDPTKAYLHGSPDVANWGRPESLAYGDAHYWGVWYGRQPFEIFNTRISRFMSEFGFQAFPEMKTIREFANENDFNIHSEVMKTHQKSSTGNDAIQEYMRKYYKMPKNFEDFVYVGLVMQGEGMKKGMLAHRRNRPYSMGSLYWQLNDSWPVVSWAGIDYYNNWKALHYKTREAFAPVACELFLNTKTNKAEFYIFSDDLQLRKNHSLQVDIIDFQGKKLKSFTEKIPDFSNETKKIKSISLPLFASEKWRKKTFVKLQILNENQQKIFQDVFFFHWPNQLKLPKTSIEKNISYTNGKYTIILKSNQLAKNVFIEIPTQGAEFSDNFFDLLPNEPKIIEITSPKLQNENLISVKHLRDTY